MLRSSAKNSPSAKAHKEKAAKEHVKEVAQNDEHKIHAKPPTKISKIELFVLFLMIVGTVFLLASNFTKVTSENSANDSFSSLLPKTSRQSALSDYNILISSHGSISSFDLLKSESKTVDEGNGVYYGIVNLDPDESWVVSSPEYTSPKDTATEDHDYLMSLHVKQRKTQIKSRFTHDAIGVGKFVFIANTFGGSVEVYKTNSDGTFLHQNSLEFAKKNHINSLAVSNDNLFILLNNLGNSQIAVVDLKSMTKRCTIENVGINSHNLVLSSNGESSIYLISSGESSLIRIAYDLNDCNHDALLNAKKDVILKYVDDDFSNPFMKGLLIVNEVAFFGVSQFQKSRKARASVETKLVAYDLATKSIVRSYSSQVTGAKGLINVVTIAGLDAFREMRIPCSRFLPLGRCRKSWVSPGHHWIPRMDLSKKTGIAFGTTGHRVHFIRLPLRFDVSLLQKELVNLETHIPYSFRADVNNFFISTVTSDGTLENEKKLGPYQPVEEVLKYLPYTKKVLSSFKSTVGRSRYMNLKANSSVSIHKDRTAHVMKVKGDHRDAPVTANFYDNVRYFANRLNGYWGRRFRVHIPIRTTPDVLFFSENVSINMETGYAYLFDNSYLHKVENPSQFDRIHLVFDTVGGPGLFDLVLGSELVVDDGEIVSFVDHYKPLVKDEIGDFKELQKSIYIGSEYPEEEMVYEYWADDLVYKPQEPRFVEGTIVRALRSFDLPTDFKRSLEVWFQKFMSRFIEGCFAEYQDGRATYKDTCFRIFEEELESLAVIIDIWETDKGVQLPDILNTLEPYFRNILYTCSADGFTSELGPPCLVDHDVRFPVS